ncbi:hypothetical protein FHT00_003019 [Sphingomonas insulae]|nr:hypothetical protein [Sphingomonas insulae]
MLEHIDPVAKIVFGNRKAFGKAGETPMASTAKAALR